MPVARRGMTDIQVATVSLTVYSALAASDAGTLAPQPRERVLSATRIAGSTINQRHDVRQPASIPSFAEDRFWPIPEIENDAHRTLPARQAMGARRHDCLPNAKSCDLQSGMIVGAHTLTTDVAPASKRNVAASPGAGGQNRPQ
jgi:hypothetical protein